MTKTITLRVPCAHYERVARTLDLLPVVWYVTERGRTMTIKVTGTERSLLRFSTLVR